MRVSPVSVLLAGVFAMVSGCGLLQGTSSDSGAPVDSRVEKPKISVAILPTVETGPLQLAIRNGYFKSAGLDVDVVIAPSGQRTVEGLVSGEYDISYSSYPVFFQAQGKGIGDFKLVADNSYAAPGVTMLMKRKDSPLAALTDLNSKTVAVTARNTLSDLMVKDAMATNGADYTTVRWVEMPFPDMQAKLADGAIDAAMMVEPFATASTKTVNAQVLTDLATGSLAELPLTGFGATAKFVEQNPRTVAAFQQGIKRAANEAQQNRAVIEPLLTQYAKIDPSIVKVTKLPGFRGDLDASQLKRVVALMKNYGVLTKDLDVDAMLAHPTS
jgi:NitT/TauT family transport system substrate-binding protein